MKPVLLDTSVVVALLDRSDNLHEACAKTIRELKAPLITCEAVIAENCYLLHNLSGAPEAVIEKIAAEICQIPLQLSRESAAVKHLLRKSARQLRLHVQRSIHLDSARARSALFGV